MAINTDTTPILRKNEEELITAAIKQSTEDVSWVMKSDSFDSPENECVSIIFENSICKLQPFKKGTMFGSMKTDYCYHITNGRFCFKVFSNSDFGNTGTDIGYLFLDTYVVSHVQSKTNCRYLNGSKGRN